jgi:hypothetical protein
VKIDIKFADGHTVHQWPVKSVRVEEGLLVIENMADDVIRYGPHWWAGYVIDPKTVDALNPIG